MGINASNLILLLQGKIYEDYACNDISGNISVVSLSEISQAVRNRVLELTIEFEKSIPAAAHITFGTQGMDKDNASKAQQITQQIIYGNVGNAISGGSESTINVSIQSHNKESVANYLKDSGISEEDALDFSLIVASETPSSSEEPFGKVQKLDCIKYKKSCRWDLESRDGSCNQSSDGGCTEILWFAVSHGPHFAAIFICIVKLNVHSKVVSAPL